MDQDKALALYNAGKNDKEISEAIGICIPTICRWRQKNGLPPLERGPRHVFDKHKAYLLWLAGKTDGEISEEMHVNLQTVERWREANSLDMNDWEGWNLLDPKTGKQFVRVTATITKLEVNA